MASDKKFPSRLSWRVPGSALLFLVIPILFVFAVSQLTKANGPQWLPSTFENPYAYLFNSLLLIEGKTPQYVYHPGTTTEVFGAIVLRLSNQGSDADLITSTLRYPEKQIRKVHRALVVFTALVLWILPWITASALGKQTVGLLIQAPVLFFQTLLYYGMIFCSDLMLVPFSIATICCCTLLLVRSPFPKIHDFLLGIGAKNTASDSIRSTRVPFLAALTGLLCGFGFVTKLTFFPLILISVFCCLRARSLMAFGAAFIIGLAFALFPIYPHLLQLATWAFKIGIHSEPYGNGPVGFPSAGVYFQSLEDLLSTGPLFAIILGVTLVLVVGLPLFARKEAPAGTLSWRTVLPLFEIQLVSFLAVAKGQGPRVFNSALVEYRP